MSQREAALLKIWLSTDRSVIQTICALFLLLHIAQTTCSDLLTNHYDVTSRIVFSLPDKEGHQSILMQLLPQQGSQIHN